MNPISISRRACLLASFVAFGHLSSQAQLATLNYLPSQTSLHKRVGIVISDLGSYPWLANITDPCGGYPLEHIQAIATLRDRGDGKTRWVITGSMDNNGWIALLEADGSPPVEVIPGQRAPGRVIWAATYDAFSPATTYNHPGDINIVGDTLVVALQNWAGNPDWIPSITCPLDVRNNVQEDAVGFYDLSNPTNPVYQGKLTSTQIFGFAREISDLRFFMAGPEYYILQVHSETFLSRSTPVPVMSNWTRSGVSVAGPAVGSGSFLGPANEYLTASVGLTPDASGDPYPPPRATISRVFMSSAGQTGFRRTDYTVPNHWGSSGYNWVGDFNGDAWPTSLQR